MPARILGLLVLGQAESLPALINDTAAAVETSAAPFSIRLWFEALPGFWQAFIPSLAAAILVVVLGRLFKVPQRILGFIRGKTRARKDSVLVDYRDFYGEDADTRHQYKFVPDRAEAARRDGELVVEESRPLDTLLNWVDGDGRLLVIHGSGGFGKSRLLFEAGKAQKSKLRFVRTRQASGDFTQLAVQVKEQAHKGDGLVFDDCQEYPGDFGRLLDAASAVKARIIAAARYFSDIEPALQRAHAIPEKLGLGLMANAEQVVPVEDEELRKRIAEIAKGNPAIAVMAWMHYQRTKSLRGIKDAFDLMKSVFEELVAAGEKLGFPDTREFLAEMAVRGGLWQDHAPYPGHERLVAELRKVGHIWQGGSPERRVYGIAPDQLRDHIIRAVYAEGGVLQSGLSGVVEAMPDEEAVHVVRMLGIQYRETENEVWKQAVALVLSKYGRTPHGPGIGFHAQPGRKPLELLIDLGYEAWKLFGDDALVRKHLGDFCAGAEKLDSTDHLNKAGLYCTDTGQPDRALACLEAGLKLAEARKGKSDQAMFLGNIGLIWHLRGELDKALEYLQKALDIQVEIGDKLGQARQLGNIGSIWYRKGDLDKALEYQEKSLALERELGNKQGEAQSLGNIGLIWQARAKGAPKDAAEACLDKALGYHKKALEVFEELGAKQEQASALGNIGLTLVQKDECEKAVEPLATALSMLIAMGIADGPRQCLSGLRMCYTALGEGRFVELCVEAGMEEEEAEAMVRRFEELKSGSDSAPAQ